jgi:hypothetical protein
LSTIGEMTASAWRSIYESHEQVIMTRTGTQILKPVTGFFRDSGVGGAVPGILVAMRAINRESIR